MQLDKTVGLSYESFGVLERVVSQPRIPLATRIVKIEVIVNKASILGYPWEHIYEPSSVVVISVPPLVQATPI